MKKLNPYCLLILANILFINGSIAGTRSRTFEVSANVPANCIISTVPQTINFGNYDVFNTTTTYISQQIGVRCTKGLGVGTNPTARIALSSGPNYFSGSRHMRLGATDQYIAYNIYQPPANTQPPVACATSGTEWTDTAPNWLILPAVTDYGEKKYNICAKVVNGQAVQASATPYIDTVTVTLVFS